MRGVKSGVLLEHSEGAKKREGLCDLAFLRLATMGYVSTSPSFGWGHSIESPELAELFDEESSSGSRSGSQSSHTRWLSSASAVQNACFLQLFCDVPVEKFSQKQPTFLERHLIIQYRRLRVAHGLSPALTVTFCRALKLPATASALASFTHRNDRPRVKLTAAAWYTAS